MKTLFKVTVFLSFFAAAPGFAGKAESGKTEKVDTNVLQWTCAREPENTKAGCFLVGVGKLAGYKKDSDEPCRLVPEASDSNCSATDEGGGDDAKKSASKQRVKKPKKTNAGETSSVTCAAEIGTCVLADKNHPLASSNAAATTPPQCIEFKRVDKAFFGANGLCYAKNHPNAKIEEEEAADVEPEIKEGEETPANAGVKGKGSLF